jgi:hypothetical protein
LVASLLIGRHNVTGGQTTVVDMTGKTLLTTTLCESGTLLLGDGPNDVARCLTYPAGRPDRHCRRDVLVITFATRSAQ